MQPVHVSQRNAVVTFQELDAAWREKLALRKLKLSQRYAEVEEAIVAWSPGRDTGNG